MADNVKWLKLMNNMFEDEKIEYIESLPDGDMILNVWIKTLCLASKCNDNGNLTITSELPYTTTLLAHKFKKTVTQIEYAFKIMQGIGMVEVNNDILCVSNWCKYQNVDELERLKEQNRLRVAKCREKKKLSQQQALQEGIIDITCKNIPYIEQHINEKRYGGNYYFVIKRDKIKCAICGSSENLCVHHIDGYDENKPENNATNKMITVCRCCHSNIHSGKQIGKEILEKIDYFRLNGSCNVTVMENGNDFALNSNSISNNINNNIVTNEEIDNYFDKIYSIYPRKVSKVQAKETFNHKLCGLEKEDAYKKAIAIYRMLERQVEVWQGENDGKGRKQEHIPHFSTWANDNVENSPNFKKGRKK